MINASVTLTKGDVDIANETCRAIEEKCGDFPIFGPKGHMSRQELFNFVAVRVALQRTFLP